MKSDGHWIFDRPMTTREHVQQNGASAESSGRNPRGYDRSASTASAAKTEHVHQTENLMEAVVERQNMIKVMSKPGGSRYPGISSGGDLLTARAA